MAKKPRQKATPLAADWPGRDLGVACGLLTHKGCHHHGNTLLPQE